MIIAIGLLRLYLPYWC